MHRDKVFSVFPLIVAIISIASIMTFDSIECTSSFQNDPKYTVPKSTEIRNAPLSATFASGQLLSTSLLLIKANFICFNPTNLLEGTLSKNAVRKKNKKPTKVILQYLITTNYFPIQNILLWRCI